MDLKLQYGNELLALAKQAYQEQLMTATSGNFSYYCRESDCMIITPSGIPYPTMTEADLVWMRLDGTILRETQHRPSSEWKMHRELYRNLPHVRAIVHTHSPNATAFAALRQEIPCVLVESLLFLGGTIEVAPYAKQGSPEVGTHALPILARKPVCLLANHGVVAVGATLQEAFAVSQYTEDTAKIVRMAMSTGLPFPADLTKEEA